MEGADSSSTDCVLWRLSLIIRDIATNINTDIGTEARKVFFTTGCSVTKHGVETKRKQSRNTCKNMAGAIKHATEGSSKNPYRILAELAE